MLSMQKAILCLALCVCHVTSSSSYFQFHPEDCWQKRAVVSLAQSNLPGAGLQKVEPFAQVLKDGFFLTGCMKDYLFEHGDKFGNNKFSYEMGRSMNVSMVHYSQLVPKEDQKSMTHSVCFDFCRTVPDMHFFGINNGRDCYCMPFFQQMASDNSPCDAVCEGDTTQMCGSKGKSSIFEMHSCADTGKVLEDSASRATALVAEVSGAAAESTALGEGMQETAEALQKIFGEAGDPVAAALHQEAKVFAGELLHAADAALTSAKSLETLAGEATAMKGADFKDHAQASKADKLVMSMKSAGEEAEAKHDVMGELHRLAQRGRNETGRLGLYYPLMYFVDRKYENVPSTCGGDHDKRAIYGLTSGNCASACDAQHENSCVGFGYYPGLCVLFQRFTSVQYYTECGGDGASGIVPAAATTSFLQAPLKPRKISAVLAGQSKQLRSSARKAESAAPPPFDAAHVQCFAKLQHFEGTNLNPDTATCKSGKGTMCLKKATKAERCFGTP